MARIVTTESMEQPYRTSCTNGHSTWFADEPESNGGLDTAPTPSELLLSAIGTCVTITLRMYARRKEWPVEKIKLDLRLESVKKENGDIKHIIYETLYLTGELTEEQKDRMKSLIPKCPVSKIVTGEVEIKW